jgi:tetratricopeptide (TPR) repeat protein
MKDTVWKRISDKRPKGAKLVKIVGILSAVVWLGALGAFFFLKDKKLPAIAEGLGTGAAKVTSGGEHSEDGEAVGEEASGGAAEEGAGGEAAEGVTVAKAEGGPESRADHGGNAAHAGKHGNGAKAGHGGNTGAEGEAASDRGEGEKDRILPSREELAALRQVAELHAAAGDLEKAVAPMRRVMLMPTRDITLLSLATDIFLGTAHYSEALATAGQVLALNPGDMRTKVQAVEAQYRLGQVDQAVAAAQAALKEHPGDLGMLTALGTIEVEMGPAHPGYGQSLQAALKLKPDHAPALYLLGRKAQLEGDYKDAEAAFRKVVKIDPHNAKAFGQLGMALYHLGKDKEAERAYRSELAMNPADYNTWFNLGELHLTRALSEKKPAVIQSLRTEAMECYLKALELNDDHPQAHYRVGVLLNGNGQYKEAIRHLEASLKTDSRYVPTLVQLSLAYENLKQLERARAYLNKAYELDPLNKVVLFKLKQWS